MKMVKDLKIGSKCYTMDEKDNVVVLRVSKIQNIAYNRCRVTFVNDDTSLLYGEFDGFLFFHIMVGYNSIIELSLEEMKSSIKIKIEHLESELKKLQ